MMHEVEKNIAENNFARYEHVLSELILDGCRPDLLPDFSVMIPTFRRIQLLRDTIESVINQHSHMRCIEIVIVDNDADSDGSELVTMINGFLPNNIRLFRNRENIGMFGNWNRCIELARASVLTILNDDDLLHPEFIKITNELALQSAISVEKVQFQEYVRFPEVKGKCNAKPLTLADFFLGNPISGSLGFVFNKRHAIELGGYNPALWPTADYDFSYRYFKRFGIKKISAKLAGYRWLENESMKIVTLEGFLANDIVFRKGVIREVKLSKLNKKIMSVLIDLMAVSASFFYKKINSDFNIEESLSNNNVRKFGVIILCLLKNKYSHHVFIVFLRLFYKKIMA